MSNTFCFLKFGKKEHLEMLQKGNLRLKSIKYYKNLEDKENNTYIGDRNEGVVIFNECEAYFKNENDENSFVIPCCNARIESKLIDRMPIFCLATLDLTDLKKVENTERTYKVELGENVIKEFSQEEWDYVMLINPPKFLEKIEDYYTKHNVGFRADYVKYDDLSINYMERHMNINKEFENVAFYKNLKYINQKEYRVLFNDLEVDEEKALNINIGDMTDFTTIIERKTLFHNMCWEIFYKKDAENNEQKLSNNI